MNDSKTCTQCGKLRPLSKFSIDRRGRDGLQVHCKFCQKKYRDENIDKINARNKAYHTQNVEKIRAQRRKSYAKNIETRKIYSRKYYKQNREKILAKSKKYVEENYEQVKNYRAKWRMKNHGRLLAGKIKDYQMNREKRKSQVRKYGKENAEKIAIRNKKHSESLCDLYISHLLANGNNLSRKDIPPELIALKRAQLRITRQLRQLKEEETDGNNTRTSKRAF